MTIMRRCFALELFTALLLATAHVFAQAPDVPAARVKSIADELRCLVCQNQTIADSHAPLAIDLRNQIVEQIKAGKSDDEIRDYMVARYGDFVLYRPPFKATTAALWIAPFAGLAFAVLLVRRLTRKRSASRAAEQPATRQQDLDKLLQ